MKIGERVIYAHPDNPDSRYNQRTGIVTGFAHAHRLIFVQLDGDDFATCFASFVIHPAG